MPGRPRTKFSAAQLQELERSFREQRYIGASEKRRLAAVLNLSQSQVSAAGAPRARLCPPPQRGDGPRAAAAPARLLKTAGEERRPQPALALVGTSWPSRGRGQ